MAHRLRGARNKWGDTTLASYTFAYSSGSGVLPESGASGSAVSSPLSPVNPGQSTPPVHDTRGIVDSLLSAVSSGQDLLTAVTSIDGTVNYSYDPTGELTGATYSAANGSAGAVGCPTSRTPTTPTATRPARATWWARTTG